jgi:2-dehydro-3-deoxygluconokinase
MSVLKFKEKGSCQYDLVSLGEVMLRFDPGEGRIHTARNFQVWEGGGEYNVARGLRRCFDMKTAIVTAFADNAIGRLLEDLILQGGVDTSFIKWREFDGCGRHVRNGLNFTERGFGIRGALGVSDRGHTAVSQLRPGDIDWEYIFATCGVRWFHTGGIFAALSETTPEVVEEAMIVAKKYNTIISYDLNYRPSLWRAIGGQQKSQEVNRRIAQYVDVMIGNEEDFTACLGYQVESANKCLTNLNVEEFKIMINKVVEDYPHFKMIATTLRAVKTASVNDWGAICWAKGGFFQATQRDNLEILDRVGGGDSFDSGFIYGMLAFNDPHKAIEYGAAHGALAMTTAGDTTMAKLPEVEKLIKEGEARIER